VFVVAVNFILFGTTKILAVIRKGGSAPKGGCSLYGLFFTSVEALLVKFLSAQWRLMF
jgi:hypothetical protein